MCSVLDMHDGEHLLCQSLSLPDQRSFARILMFAARRRIMRTISSGSDGCLSQENPCNDPLYLPLTRQWHWLTIGTRAEENSLKNHEEITLHSTNAFATRNTERFHWRLVAPGGFGPFVPAA